MIRKKGLRCCLFLLAMILPISLFAGGRQEVAGPATTEIEFWMPGQEPTIRSTMEDLIVRFESQNPGVKVNYSQTPWNEYFTKITAAIAGGTTPDIVGLGYGQFGMLVTRGVFAPIPADPRFALDDLAEWARRAGTYEGNQYAVLLPATKPLTYRKDMFREAGLDPERPPRDWNELLEYATALTVRDRDQVTRAGVDITFVGSGEQIFLTFYAQRKKGAQLWDEGGKPSFNTPEGIETLEYLVALHREHNVVLPSDVQAITGSAFEQGIAAMGYSWSQALPALIRSRPDDIGFALPAGGGNNATLTLGTFLAVFDGSPQKDAAMDFLAFLISEESMWEIYERILFLPTRNSLRDRFLNDQPYNAILLESLDNSASYNVNPFFGEARAIFSAEIEQAFYGNKTPAQALADAERRMLALLE